MSIFRRLLFWLVATPAYWYCARWFVGFAFPIYFDDGGPAASLGWGSSRATPTIGEWNSQLAAQIAVEYPYLIAASIVTVLGCGLTTWLVRMLRPCRLRLFPVAAVTTFVPLVLLEMASDLCNALRIWRAPTEFGWIDSLVFFKVIVPMSLLAGGVAVLRARLNGDAVESVQQTL